MQYTDAWNNVVQRYTIWLKKDQDLSLATVSTLGDTPECFQKKPMYSWRDIPKRAYNICLKRALKRKELRFVVFRSTVKKAQ